MGLRIKGVALANVRVRVFDVVTGKRVSVSGAKFEVLYNDVSMGSIATDTSGTAVIKDLLANLQQRIFCSKPYPMENPDSIRR